MEIFVNPYIANRLATITGAELNELKFEITDRCNLSCSFCHQNFGISEGSQVLDLGIYLQLLKQAWDEGIRSIRLTGGEPLVVKHIQRYLEPAKQHGFYISINTNGTALTEARLAGLRGLVDCFKLSLPASNEVSMTALTGSRKAWEKKLLTLNYLMASSFQVEILTVMVPDNIKEFDTFLTLLSPFKLIWSPLRAEPQPNNRRPVSLSDIRLLAKKLHDAHTKERWKDLELGLGVPFCVLDNPFDALSLFSGGKWCGPVNSLVVTSHGTVAGCYSRRLPLNTRQSLREASAQLARADFLSLPMICQECTMEQICRGGCRCDLAREMTENGNFDYLAVPTGIKERLARGLDMDK